MYAAKIGSEYRFFCVVTVLVGSILREN